MTNGGSVELLRHQHGTARPRRNSVFALVTIRIQPYHQQRRRTAYKGLFISNHNIIIHGLSRCRRDPRNADKGRIIPPWLPYERIYRTRQAAAPVGMYAENPSAESNRRNVPTRQAGRAVVPPVQADFKSAKSEKVFNASKCLLARAFLPCCINNTCVKLNVLMSIIGSQSPV